MNCPLQAPVRQQASRPSASAVFQLPAAPGMQKEPRGAAVQACVREQRALSLPKKQPGRDFHLIGPSVAAAGRPCLESWREPRDGTLHGSIERTLCYDDYGVLSPTGPEHPCVLPRGRGAETRKRGGVWKSEKMRERLKHENIWKDALKRSKNMLCWYWWKGKWDWSQTGRFYLNSQDVFSELCCLTEKPSGSRKKSHCISSGGLRLKAIKSCTLCICHFPWSHRLHNMYKQSMS